MIQQIIKWFLRVIYRYRLNRIGKKYSDGKHSKINQLHDRVELLDIGLFDSYTSSQGMNIELYLGFYNAEETINAIDELSDAFVKRELVGKIADVIFNRKVIRFDEFLVNNKKADVPVKLFISEYKRAVKQLHASHQIAIGDNIRRGYYQRKSEDFIVDLFDILEALEEISLAETH